MSRTFGWGWMLLGLVVVASPVSATVRDPAFGLKIVDLPTDVAIGETVDVQLLFRARSGLELRAVTLESPSYLMSARHRLPAVSYLSAGSEITLSYRITPLDFEDKLTLRFDVDGVEYAKRFDLAPEEIRKQRVTGTFRCVDPPPASAPAPPSPTRILTTSGVVSFDHDGENFNVYGARATIWGKVGFQNFPLGFGITNRMGRFSFEIMDLGTQVDSYSLVISSSNGAFRVMVDDLFYEDVYLWTGPGKLPDQISGSNLEWGSVICEGRVGALNIINSIYRAEDFLLNNSIVSNIDYVDVWWPTSDGSSHYTREDDGVFQWGIFIRDISTWMSTTHAHEYGHHFLIRHAESPPAHYCNPGDWCDPDPDAIIDPDCSHCNWCPENANVAFTEGVPYWIADTVCRRWQEDEWVSGPTGTVYFNRAIDCSKQAGYYGEPLITEGAFAALLVDMVSPGQTTDPHYPGYTDRLTVQPSEILNTILLDTPISPHQFINAFRARYSGYNAEFWETCMTNGYDDYDSTAPTPGSITSPSHPVGDARPAAEITVDFSGYSDDFSGINAFEVIVTPTGQSTPVHSQIHSANLTRIHVGPFAAGSYDIRARPRDAARNWAATYQTYGPAVIREPIAADFTPDPLNSSWAYPVVPKDVQVSDPNVVPADVTMISSTTYWNASIANLGEVRTFQSSALFVDGVFVDSLTGWVNAWGEHLWAVNQGPISMPGGRHSFELFTDAGQAVAESDETNNHWGSQWIWWPTQLSAGSTYYSDGPPPREAGWEYGTGTLWYLCNGYRLVTSSSVAPNPWAAVWANTQHSSRDVDVRIHDAATGAKIGFDRNLGWSDRPAGYLDAVLVNAETRPASYYDVGILNGVTEDDPTPYRAEVAYGLDLVEDVPHGAQLGTQDGLHLYTIMTQPGLEYVVTLERDDPYQRNQPLWLTWYGHDFATGKLMDYDAIAVTDSTTRVDMVFVASNTGSARHGLAVWRNPIENDFGAQDYTIEVREKPADLAPIAPSGWAQPVVPRPTMDATGTSAPEPTVLVGDAASTYFNYSIGNLSSMTSTSTYQATVRVDGVGVELFYHGTLAGGGVMSYLSPTGREIRGGRHVVSLIADLSGTIDELDETNNSFATQYVWRPSNLSFGSLMHRSDPPPRTIDWDLIAAGETLWYSCDAKRTPTFKPSGTSSYWGAVATMPAAGGNVDLKLYEWSTGARDGFVDALAVSQDPAGAVDFVLMNFRNTPLKYYDVGVFEGGGTPGGGYDITVAQSVGGASNPDGVLGTYTLTASELIDLHEINFTTTGLYRATLSVADPAVDLGFSLYGPDLVRGAKIDVKNATAGAWHATGTQEDTFDFTVLPGDTGRHCLTVWKVGPADVPLSTAYTVTIELVGATEAPPSTIPDRTRLVGVRPNPFNPQTTITYELHEPGRARLRVYDFAGRLVRRLQDIGVQPAGSYDVIWDGKDDAGRSVSTGVYFCCLEASGQVETARMSLIK